MDYSFQLYGARNFPPVVAILPRLRALGYTQVEGFGGLYTDVDGLAAAMKANNLTMPTGHFGLDDLKDTGKAMKIADKLGMKTLFCPAVPAQDRAQPESGWKALAATLGELGEIYTKAGYRFGWHNHNFEFVPTKSGRLPMEIILDEAPNISWQCDVAWVVKGKHDPIDWMKRYANRLVSIHVKDIAPAGECADEDGWADVGHGTMDWKAIINFVRKNTKCKSFVMEHDNPNDVDRFATRSIAFCKTLGD